ncbi:HAMP domain-containing sensor histidine kinase [Streptomyces sp. TRM 70351]|uniref:sensor histidine kinase n=1 Tax=Streptomyces sp. TRM 70351 TaxID=3116552 RepID=UPI002E7B1B65|nr:HAMP domain-containing sensor histidine kinase [Streptomyces sp. TRM 70351]MEE1927467.1 HAMP domain-containing sensor histidine kinase [Streptomyces sp. TRM 70351]
MAGDAPRRPFGTVRAKATAGATAVVALALALAAGAVLWLLEANLIREVELRAEVQARDIAGQLATGVAFADIESAEGPVQIVDGARRVRGVSDGLEALTGTSSPSVEPVAVPPAAAPTAPAPGTGDGGDDDGGDDGDDGDDGEDDDEDDGVRLPAGPGDVDGAERLGPGQVDGDVEFTDGTATVDGRRGDYRYAVAEVVTPRGEPLTVYAGAPLALEQAAVGTVRTALLVGVPLMLVVVAATTSGVIARALRPVEGIRRSMAEITRSTDLSRRVPEPAVRDEIGRLARTTNETLAALEGAVERQRRFVADASHELRSPIASLRTQLEVGEAHPELLDVAEAVQDTVRLQDLAADLLLLARLDAGERPVQGRVALPALVHEELARRTADRVPVACGPAAGAEVAGSRAQVARVLGNLLDNAQRHADAVVRVSVRRTGRWAVLEVADDGAGVPPGERERIFERFVRLDDARSRDDGGAGLGLAIAREVAARHGGSLTVGEAPEGGALFALRLPALT